MNIILLGGTVSKRLKIKNDLKVRMKNISKNKIICGSRILEFYDLVFTWNKSGPIKMNPNKESVV